MKKLALWLSVLGTMTAQAEILTSGGFGTKGTTGESIPLSSSVSDAAAIYHAMKIKPVMGRKGLKLDDGTSFECEEPRSNNFSGMSASCVFIFRETAKAQIIGGRINQIARDLKFSGQLAKDLYSVITDREFQTNYSTREVANLKCSKGPGRGGPVTCTILDTIAVQADVEL